MARQILLYISGRKLINFVNKQKHVMSILVENENGWFIDSKYYFDNIYKQCIDDNSKIREFKFRSAFFQIKTPYVMKSHAMKLAKTLETKMPVKMQHKKSKKNSHIRTSERNSLENTVLNEKSECLINAARHLNCLNSSYISPVEWFENNHEAQKAAKEVLNMSINSCTPSEYCNSNNASVLVTFGAEEYILPAQSRFHLCDINNVTYLKGRKYDLIVLDPPWENKSVRRKKRYATLGCESLLDLPVEELCHPGCLIVIWITNNKTQLNFIKEKLLPKWEVLDPVMWHWMKITQKGHFIHPIDWHHKKPYENLLLGRTACNSKSSELPAVAKIEPDKIILSVPSSIHSHKPPLVEILKPYIPEHADCLELFARYLLPGWTSLGNEVLKLQNIKLFERTS